MRNEQLHLIGHQLCPYVQRVAIVLEEKGVTYKRTDIDLDNKPSWLKMISPTEKIPLLVIGNNLALFESNVICEFIDEISKGSLHPSDPITKAQHRAWIEFGTAILDLIADLIYRDKTKKAFENTLCKINQKIRHVETAIEGPEYFVPSGFHMVDAAYSTLFRYFIFFEGTFDFDLLRELPKSQNWSRVLMKRRSVKNAVPKGYDNLLRIFIQNKNSYLADLIFTQDKAITGQNKLNFQRYPD